MKNKTKIVAVFSAPIVNYEGRICSMTDVALRVGRSYASSNPVEVDVLRQVYERIAIKHLCRRYRKQFLGDLDKFYRQVIISLKQAAENKNLNKTTGS